MAYTAAAATVMMDETSAPPTETPTPSNTPLPTATATPAWITTGFVINGPLNLRNGPGTFFDSYGGHVVFYQAYEPYGKVRTSAGQGGSIFGFARG